MNEEKLRELFKNYQPDMQSDHAFMEDLAKRLSGIEILEQEIKKQRVIYVKAAFCALLAGFMAGLIFFIIHSESC